MPQGSSSRPYRIDWWSRLETSPGEWGGRWQLASSASDALKIARAALEQQSSNGLVLIALLGQSGMPAQKVVVDSITLGRWLPDEAWLPPSDLDPTQLPPLGREDLEHITMLRCREALVTASKADLLETTVVTAIIEIIQQAFAGIGPAAEVGAIIQHKASG